MLHLVSDGVSLPITPELILAGVRTGEFTAADTASVGGNTHEKGAAEQPSGPLGTGATLFLRPVLAPQGPPGGDAADTVSLWLAAALSCPTGFISVLSEAAGSVVVSGNLPKAGGKYSMYCAVIVKRVDAKTRATTSLNDLLRD